MSLNVHHLNGNLLVGSSHFYVDTLTNKVGITTTNPDAGLHVNSNAYVTTDFRVGADIAMNVTSGRITAGSFEGDGSLLQGINSDSGSWVNGASSNVHLATTSDMVGVGTVDPDFKLDVHSDVFTSTRFKRTTAAGGLGIKLENGDGDVWNIGTGSTGTFGIYNGSVFGEQFFIDTTGHVGINAINPGYSTLSLHHEDTTAAGGGNAVYFDVDLSGADATGGDITYRGLFVDVDSTATGGTTGDEHRVYAIVGQSTCTGDSDRISGLYGVAEANHTSGTCTTVIGVEGYATAGDGGGTTTNGYSGYFRSLNKTPTATTNVLVGCYGEVQTDGAGTVTNARALQAHIDRNAGSITNGFLLYGTYATSTSITNRWGIYLTSNVDKNRLDGRLGLGVDPEDDFRLKVNGNVNVEGTTRFQIRTDTANHVIAGNWYSSAHSLSLVSAGSININVDYNANDSNKNIDFRTNTSTDGGTLLMRVNEGGGVFIGDQAPYGTVTYVSAQLALAGTHNGGYNRSNYVKLLISGGNNDGGSPYYIMCEDENGYEQMWVKGATSDGGGNAQLYIKGQVKMASSGDTYALIPGNDGWLRLQGAASGQGNLNGSYTSLAVGNFYAAGATRFSSDDRVKHFEEEIPNALELIQQLKPYKYKKTGKIYDEDYTGDIGEDWEWEIGLIAQDVEKIPYLEHTVSKPEDSPSDTYGLNYTQFIGVCIQGIKDLSKELQTEKDKVATMELLVASLEERLANHTHPLEPHTHPELEERLTNHTHPDLVDQLAIEKAKNQDLQQRLTLLEHSHTALVARLEALENM